MTKYKTVGPDQDGRMYKIEATEAQLPVERLVNWQPIETAPTTGRQKIILKTPHNQSGVLAYSNTWWTAGFSAECKPTHWAPAS